MDGRDSHGIEAVFKRRLCWTCGVSVEAKPTRMRIRHGAVIRQATPRSPPPKVAVSSPQASRTSTNTPSSAFWRVGQEPTSRLPPLDNKQWFISRLIWWTVPRRLWQWVWERAIRVGVSDAPERTEIGPVPVPISEVRLDFYTFTPRVTKPTYLSDAAPSSNYLYPINLVCHNGDNRSNFGRR